MLQRSALAPLVLFAAASCSGGGGSGHAGTTSFQVEALSLPDGAVWEINREIVLRFSEPVDFSTVSANTIHVRSDADVPAIGTFRLRDPFTVVFQPTCPTQADYSDAGLQPGGVRYVLRVPGRDSSSHTVRSTGGVPLGIGQTRHFTTPASLQPALVFRDTLPGPPEPIVRAPGSSQTNATYLEIGGDSTQRVYFERDGAGELLLSVPGFEAPLNLYSDLATRIAVEIAFDQPISPEADNLSARRLFLEFRGAHGTWHPLETRVSLSANCTEVGASVRLEPLGVLPPASAVRAVIAPGFHDLIGEPVPRVRDDFCLAPTRAIEFTSLQPADALGDALDESFAFGGDSPLSFEDTDALFDTPVADWGEGKLAAAFAFEGQGGPNGDFDWVVHAGELFFFDTTRAEIIGGRDGVPTTLVNVVNGIVDVRNFTIEAGGEVRVQGPNPLRIRATGEVRIRGRLDVSGLPARDVISFGSGNLREVGPAGVGGGGRGGTGNLNVAGPTPRGGRGGGPFDSGDLGGEGGEMGVSNDNSKNARRPGGGGGGRFTKDWIGTRTFSGLSVAAMAGSDGHPRSTGAVSGGRPASGGTPGQGPFIDTNDANDFFGVRPIVTDGALTGLIRGELPGLWAGYGGGAGGNAGKRFPNPSWNFNSDEKGGAGGGGGGALHIQALGRIVFGRSGQILSNGGRGATGENTAFLDHIGGTGGGGSGGHVILESATAVDFTDGGASIDANLRDFILAAGPQRETGPTGNVDTCQASALCCASPEGCSVYSNGGAGGGGLIQIHVPDPTKPPGLSAPAEIRVPAAALAEADVIDHITSPPAYVLIPTFGRRSKARSDWIPIGAAGRKPDGSEGLVRFLFEGLDPTTGRIQTSGERVADRAPLASVADLSTSSTARILADGFTLELVGASLDAIRTGTTAGISNDCYLRTPALLEDCAVRMRVSAASFEDFTIAKASYDEGQPSAGDEVLRVTIGGARPLTAFDPGGAEGPIGVQLLPRFFLVVTNGVQNALPTTAFVSLRFQAAGDNGNGAPDENHPLTVPAWTSDVSLFNALDAGALRYFRYEVEFDLDKDGRGIRAGTVPVTLDFLKIPFVF